MTASRPAPAPDISDINLSQNEFWALPPAQRHAAFARLRAQPAPVHFDEPEAPFPGPADGFYALDIVRKTGGAIGSVTDDEIVEGIRLLARTEGIFAETAGGVTIATLAQLAAKGVVRPDERVVAYVTGNGLKTVDAVAPATRR